ncbi:MAG: glycosyltransferase [candidate division Zixibacteria bacterium]
MRITILTIGSRGDIEPYVALSEGLSASGNNVRIATHENYKKLIISKGLEYSPLEGNPQEVLENEAGRKWLETGKRINPIVFMKRMMDAAKSIMPRLLDDAIEACKGADLIMTHGLAGLAAISIGEKFKVKVLPAYLQHVHPAKIYPSPMATPIPKLGSYYNLMTYFLAAQGYWQLMRPHINRWRDESLGLPPFSFKGPLTRQSARDYRFLYGFSPNVLPKAPEWGDNIHITGYWFLNKSNGWTPPRELADFIESGEPPVFVGFSSMTNREPETVTRIVIEALKKAGYRGIIATGWGGLGHIDLPETIYKIESAPFDWLFPRMAAVVHHGGAGTTATGLRAGVPTIVVPFFGDQFFWGWRVSELGVGPRAIPRSKLNSEDLSARIIEAVSDKAMKSRAVELGKLISAEDGVGNAVEIIDRLLQSEM